MACTRDDPVDILVFGTGDFAARIVLDIAATALRPVRVLVAGRNRERAEWVALAANARAVIFGSPARTGCQVLDLDADGQAAELIARCQPSVVVQAASAQSSQVISKSGDAWSQLVAAGGLSVTAVFQARLSLLVARALARERPGCHFVNCCYPDVVNGLIAAAGLPVTCGVGNVAILGAAFAAALGEEAAGPVRVLAHYSTITPFRSPAQIRSGPAPRVWIGEQEVADPFADFRGVKLTAEPVIDISGAAGVPLLLALAAGQDWRGHAPGPNGLPGGYPVALRAGILDLDLPKALTREDAIAWNARFDRNAGLVVDAAGHARYTGPVADLMRAADPELGAGFNVHDMDRAYAAMVRLRARLQAEPARRP